MCECNVSRKKIMGAFIVNESQCWAYFLFTKIVEFGLLSQ
jgi:hypothetical protein